MKPTPMWHGGLSLTGLLPDCLSVWSASRISRPGQHTQLGQYNRALISIASKPGDAEPNRDCLRPGRRLRRRAGGPEAAEGLGPGGPLAEDIAGVGREGPE